MHLQSDAERHYLTRGAARGIRADGRLGCDIRATSVETGLLSHASGSARVRLGESTDILVGIKPELRRVDTNAGIITFSIEVSNIGGTTQHSKEVEAELGGILGRLYERADELRKELYVGKGWAWELHVDALVVQGGSMATSWGVYLALRDCKLPNVIVENEDEVEVDEEGVKGGLKADLPVVVQVGMVGGEWFVDCTEEEGGGDLWIGVGKGGVWGVGGGGISVDAVKEGVVLATGVGGRVREELERKVRREGDVVGFFA